MKTFTLPLLALAAALPGCADESDLAFMTDEEILASESQDLIGAEDSEAEAPATSVVQVAFPPKPGDDRQCTATKIGPRRFLTAAHCLADPADPVVTVGTDIQLSNSTAGVFDFDDGYKISAVFVHPSYLNKPNATTRMRDVAIFEVADDFLHRTDAIPALTVRAKPITDNTVGTQIGFGCESEGGPTSNKRQASMKALTLAKMEELTTFMLDVFAAGIYGHDLVHDNETGVKLCPGDSGGPFLVPSGNTWQIGAIASATSELRPSDMPANHEDEHDFSYLARTGGVSRWIASPNPGKNQFGTNAWGTLLNLNSDMCMGGRLADNTIRQFYCDGRDLIPTAAQPLGDVQYWQVQPIADSGLFKIVNGRSKKCLTVDANNFAVQVACVANPPANSAQAWKFEPTGGHVRVRNGSTLKCLGLVGGTQVHGEPIKQFACNTTASQRWDFVR